VQSAALLFADQKRWRLLVWCRFQQQKMATAALDLEKRLDKRRKDRDLQNEPDDPAYNGRNDFIYQLFIMGCIYLLGTAAC